MQLEHLQRGLGASSRSNMLTLLSPESRSGNWQIAIQRLAAGSRRSCNGNRCFQMLEVDRARSNVPDLPDDFERGEQVSRARQVLAVLAVLVEPGWGSQRAQFPEITAEFRKSSFFAPRIRVEWTEEPRLSFNVRVLEPAEF